jgi:hypothetical protein
MFVPVYPTYTDVNKSSWAFLYYHFSMPLGPQACDHDSNLLTDEARSGAEVQVHGPSTLLPTECA